MTNNIESFETARLRADRIAELHYPTLQKHWSHEQVMSHLGGPRSEEKMRSSFQAALDHWTQFGFGRWVWRETNSGKFVGLAGFRCITLDGWPEISLGCGLQPEFWGQGYATELTRNLTALAFERLGMESIIGLAVPENLASRRVMEKIGMHYNRETTYDNLPHVLYEITHAQWTETHLTN